MQRFQDFCRGDYVFSSTLRRVRFILKHSGSFCPGFADELIGRLALECFQPSSKVAGHQKSLQRGFQQIVRLIVVAFYRSIFDFDGSIYTPPIAHLSCRRASFHSPRSTDSTIYTSKSTPLRGTQSKKPACISKRAFKTWRRGRDSNPRWAINPHTLSRRAT